MVLDELMLQAKLADLMSARDRLRIHRGHLPGPVAAARRLPARPRDWALTLLAAFPALGSSDRTPFAS